MKALIRFKGGCGGNFLKTQLHYHSSQNHTLYKSTKNSHSYTHSPFRIFQKYTVPRDVCVKYGIPYGSQWYEVPQDLIEKIIIDINATDDILLMHLVFKQNFNPDPLFGLYELIDIYPSQRGFWITQALQFYKSAFIKERTLPLVYREDDMDRHNQIVEFYNQNGWYPSYWGWTIEHPVEYELDDVEDFIERHGSCHRWEHKLKELYMTGREFVIKGEDFVLDVDGVTYTKMMKEYGMKPYNGVYHNFKAYAKANIEVLQQLGVYELTKTGHTPDEQLAILKKTFLPIYKQLIDK